jgi:N-methylhydantoinase A
MTRVRIASDVGGTFTDSLAYDEDQAVFRVCKVPTTPDNRAVGTVQGLKQVLGMLGRTGAEVNYVGHGMTTATNAVIQRKGANIAFISNEGFRDMLEIGRQNRPRLYDYRVSRPAPIARRAHRYTVTGRLDYTGRELQSMDIPQIKAVASRIRTSGVEAVAVCLLHAYANPVHEQTVKSILEAELPGVFICISTDIIREFREYERASTVALNAYLIPIMDRYLASLETLLVDTDKGLGVLRGTPVMVMEASGGLMTVASARAKPIHTVLSGPAGGVVASAEIAARSNIGNIITMDMGGTSTDISLIIDAKPQITSQASLEGMPVRIPVVDINAIGAGGGSIAFIDEGGALRVGPQSAEAEPGPACYCRGGSLPTVTDANLVLGRLGADTALGGELTLDRAAAHNAIKRQIAEPLNIDAVRAATGIIRVANANMERGIRVVSVERGHDPREFVLVPFGGAGPLHSNAIAANLSIPRVMVPPAPGILCAMGMLMSDLRHDLVETRVQPLVALHKDELLHLFEPLLEQAERLLADDGVGAEHRRLTTILDMRYIGQSYELMIPVTSLKDTDSRCLLQMFHDMHRQKFDHADDTAPVEIVNLRVLATGQRPPFALPKLATGGPTPPPAARRRVRAVYFNTDDTAGAWHDCPVWRREDLLAGNKIDGPAVIEELSSTTLLRPGDRAEVDPFGNILIDIAL